VRTSGLALVWSLPKSPLPPLLVAESSKDCTTGTGGGAGGSVTIGNGSGGGDAVASIYVGGRFSISSTTGIATWSVSPAVLTGFGGGSGDNLAFTAGSGGDTGDCLGEEDGITGAFGGSGVISRTSSSAAISLFASSTSSSYSSVMGGTGAAIWSRAPSSPSVPSEDIREKSNC